MTEAPKRAAFRRPTTDERKENVPIRCRVSASQAARLQRQTWSDKVPLFTGTEDQAVPAAVKKQRTHTHWPPASQHPRIKTAQCIGLHENTHNAGNHRPIQTDCHAWYTAHSPQPKCAISIWLMSVNRWCFVFLVNKPQSGMHNKASNVICYELSRWNISIGIC